MAIVVRAAGGSIWGVVAVGRGEYGRISGTGKGRKIVEIGKKSGGTGCSLSQVGRGCAAMFFRAVEPPLL